MGKSAKIVLDHGATVEHVVSSEVAPTTELEASAAVAIVVVAAPVIEAIATTTGGGGLAATRDGTAAAIDTSVLAIAVATTDGQLDMAVAVGPTRDVVR